jgi:hypothetical protein
MMPVVFRRVHRCPYNPWVRQSAQMRPPAKPGKTKNAAATAREIIRIEASFVSIAMT